MNQPLPNVKHEQVAMLVAQGESPTAAYQSVYKCAYGTAGSNAFRLHRDRSFKERVAFLVDEYRKEKFRSAAITKEEAFRYLRDAVYTPVGELDEQHYLAQSVDVTESGAKIKGPDKLRALEMSLKISGEFEPTRHEVKIDAVSYDDWLSRLSQVDCIKVDGEAVSELDKHVLPELGNVQEEAREIELLDGMEDLAGDIEDDGLEDPSE